MADEKDNEKLDSAEKPWWSETMKEITLTGLAAVFMTEESVKNYLREKKLPKEMASLLLDGLGKKKDDFYGLLAKEWGKVLSKLDLTKEISKFLEEHTVEISFKKKGHDENADK